MSSVSALSNPSRAGRRRAVLSEFMSQSCYSMNVIENDVRPPRSRDSTAREQSNTDWLPVDVADEDAGLPRR